MPRKTNPWYSYITNYKYHVFMETPIKMVHAGHVFYGGHVFEDVGSDNTVEFVVDVGNEFAHVSVLITNGGDCIANMFEDNDITDMGTQVSIINKNRKSDITNGIDMYYNPTVDSYGDSIFPDNGIFSPGGSRNLNMGGGAFEKTYNILKSNTNYVIQATNKTNSAITIGISVEYFTIPNGIID